MFLKKGLIRQYSQVCYNMIISLELCVIQTINNIEIVVTLFELSNHTNLFQIQSDVAADCAVSTYRGGGGGGAINA